MRVRDRRIKYLKAELMRLSYDQILGVYVELYNSYLRKSNKFYDLNYSKFVMEFVKDNTKLCIFLNMLYFRNRSKHTFLCTAINEYRDSIPTIKNESSKI